MQVGTKSSWNKAKVKFAEIWAEFKSLRGAKIEKFTLGDPEIE